MSCKNTFEKQESDKMTIQKPSENTNVQFIKNADKIRAMTDEELSVFLLCPAEYDLNFDKTCVCTGEMSRDCNQCTLKWLRQKAN